jgi:hypothetical protein
MITKLKKAVAKNKNELQEPNELKALIKGHRNVTEQRHRTLPDGPGRERHVAD